MKKIRKNITMFLVLAMVFQLVIPMAGNFAFGEEELVEESGLEEMGEDLGFGILSDGEDVIEKMTLDEVTLTFSKGGVAIPPDQDIPADADVAMEFVFSIEDLEGGTFYIDKEYIIELSDKIKILEDWTFNLTIEDEDTKENVVVGVATVDTNGDIKIKLNEKIKTFEARQLGVTATGNLVKGNLGEGGNQTIPFTFEGETTDVDIKVEDLTVIEGLTLEKEGSYDFENDEINWTIKVKPTSNQAGRIINNVKITDTILGTNHLFVSSDPVATLDTDGNRVWNLGDLKAGQEYTINLVTKPNDGVFEAAAESGSGDIKSSVTFGNQVSGTFGTDDTSVGPVTKNLTVEKDYINKTGQFLGRDQNKIKWTIVLNEGGKATIPKDATVSDTMGANLEFVAGSIVVSGLTKDTDYSLGTDGFPITFLKDIKEQVTITYETKITNTGDAYDPDKSVSYSNTANLNLGGGNTKSSTGGVGIGRNIISKNGNGYNASNYEVYWRIIVNSSNLDIVNPVVTDVLDSRLEFVSYRVGSTGTSYTGIGEDQHPNWKFNREAGTFTYVEGEGDATLKIRQDIYVTTRIKEANRNEYGGINGQTTFTNNVTLNGDNLIEDKWKSSSSVDYISKVIEKTGVYDYTDREATWTIVVNQNNMSIPNAVVSDVIGDNHDFVAGSLEYKTVGDTSAVKILEKTEASGDVYYELSNKELTINLGNITKQTEIRFKTKITNPDAFFLVNSNITIKNDATIYGDTIISVGQASKTAEVPIKNEIVTKGHKYTNGSDFIEWEVVINSNKIDLGENVTLEDDLDNLLILDEHTVKLYKLLVDSNGNYKDGSGNYKLVLDGDGKPVEHFVNTNYTYEVDNKVVFTIPGQVEDAYLLKFTTDIDGTQANTSIPNTIYLSGSHEEPFESDVEFSIQFNHASGWAIGNRAKGSLTIIKLGEGGEEDFLAGAKFELLDQNKNQLNPRRVDITDEDGSIVFDDLPIGKYYIKEIEAPEGYTNADDILVELKKGVTSKYVTETIGNELIRGNIVFDKYGIDGESEYILPGAVFELQDADGNSFNPPITAESDDNGRVEFNNIIYGDYTIVEIEAPSGYVKSDETWAVSIVEDGVTITLSGEGVDPVDSPYQVDNTKIRGNLEITKVARGSERPLKGAEFTLYRDSQGKNVVAGPLASDEDGIVIFENLEYGDYWYEETKAPSGYYRNTSKVKVSIVKHEDTIEHTMENSRIVDPPSDPEGRIRIVKKDTATGQLLADAVFNIVDAKGRVVDTVTTDSKGEATSKYLVPGEYTIEEVEAPEGYSLLVEGISHRITNGLTKEVVINNEIEEPEEPTDPEDPEDPEEPTDPQEPGDPSDPDEFEDVDGGIPGGGTDAPELPKTGDGMTWIYPVMGIVMIGLGLGLRRRNRIK